MTNAKTTDREIPPYKLIKRIAKGGMGEIFLIYDPICEREIALKKIRSELCKNKIIRKRFLKEATITAQLTHPSILPIYTIHVSSSSIYYTMPYIEGETLKNLLQRAQKQKELCISHETSLSSFIRIFLQICEAIAYAHAKDILHRDIKPENIMVGKYGEVILLDWGIAQIIGQEENTTSGGTDNASSQLTMPGKLAGTLTYMAPERAEGMCASKQTDIYALGVMLYQILTFTIPFQRPNIKAFRKYVHTETLINPIEKAPYRDIPHHLSQICIKCLEKDPQKRYQSLDDLVQDLQGFIAGRPEWIYMCQLDPHNKKDWQFQENLLLTKHLALTRQTDIARWYNVMVSQSSFFANIKIEADIVLEKEAKGFGILLSVPNLQKNHHFDEGYCLWIGSEEYPVLHFYRNHVLIKENTHFQIHANQKHHIIIEKFDHYIRFFLDDILYLTYQSHLPLSGTHVGIICRDDKFNISNMQIYSGSYHVMVSCLAVADAFFNKKAFDTALEEYRRISASFPGRAEGREALFRSGLTLLEKAKTTQDRVLFQEALDEFEKLHNTPGAPLEYLGKAQVYATIKDSKEEAKCIELALRKFPNHPLLSIIEEYAIYRCHASSHQSREIAYRLALICLRYISYFIANNDTQKLLLSLQNHWENLYFIEKIKEELPDKDFLIIEIAFRLGRRKFLLEILDHYLQQESPNILHLQNLLFALLEMNEVAEVVKALQQLDSKKYKTLQWIKLASSFTEKDPKKIIEKLLSQLPPALEFIHKRTLLYIIQSCLDNNTLAILPALFQKIQSYNIKKDFQLEIDAYRIWYHLLCHEEEMAKKIFLIYPKDLIQNETSPLYWLYGLWLLQSGKKPYMIKHFSHTLEIKQPRTSALLGRFLTKKINRKTNDYFFYWEEKQLHRQLILYYRLLGEEKKVAHYVKKLQQAPQE